PSFFVFLLSCYFFFSSRRRHTRSKRDWSSDVCSSDLWVFKLCFIRFRIFLKLSLRNLYWTVFNLLHKFLVKVWCNIVTWVVMVSSSTVVATFFLSIIFL